MSVLTIRNLEPETHQRIREVAAENSLSMEEQVRRVLRREFAPSSPTAGEMAERIHKRLKGAGELFEHFEQPQEMLADPKVFSDK